MNKSSFLPLAFVLPLLSACGKKDPVLAQVGPYQVHASDLRREVDALSPDQSAYLKTSSGKKELLDLFIKRKVLLAQAVDAGTSSPELKQKLAELNAQYESQKSDLERQRRENQERLILGDYLRKLKDSDIKVADDEVKAFWEKEVEVRVSHILVSTREKADELRARLDQKADFAELAKKNSEDAGSAPRGGDLGFHLRGDFVRAFEDALFALKTGETSGVVSSPFGFHILRRTEDRPLSKTPLTPDASARIRSVIEKKKLDDWMATAAHRYAVRTDSLALDQLTFTPAPRGPMSRSPDGK